MRRENLQKLQTLESLKQIAKTINVDNGDVKQKLSPNIQQRKPIAEHGGPITDLTVLNFQRLLNNVALTELDTKCEYPGIMYNTIGWETAYHGQVKEFREWLKVKIGEGKYLDKSCGLREHAFNAFHDWASEKIEREIGIKIPPFLGQILFMTAICYAVKYEVVGKIFNHLMSLHAMYAPIISSYITSNISPHIDECRTWYMNMDNKYVWRLSGVVWTLITIVIFKLTWKFLCWMVEKIVCWVYRDDSKFNNRSVLENLQNLYGKDCVIPQPQSVKVDVIQPYKSRSHIPGIQGLYSTNEGEQRLLHCLGGTKGEMTKIPPYDPRGLSGRRIGFM